jgi:hypothetical protein
MIDMGSKYRVLIMADHFAVASGRYLADAFKRIGHEVRTLGREHGTAIWNIEVPARHVWQPDYRGIEDFMTADWRPDLILAAWPGYDLRYGGTPVAVINVDNHVQAREPSDHFFLAHHDGAALPVDDSREDMTWLPCAAESAFQRLTLPSERKIHAAMLGNIYKNRAQLLATITPEFHVATGLGPLFDEYEAIYNRAVVSICLSHSGDAGCRIFETARMGCVMLCDPVPDFERLGFLPGVHYLPFTTPAEAVEQLRDLFSGPQSRIDELADNAYRWSLPHTWENRAQTVIDVLQKRGILP